MVETWSVWDRSMGNMVSPGGKAGTSEVWDMRDCSELLSEGEVGVDIGAEVQVGKQPDENDWTGRMLLSVGVTGKVYAFEPDPIKFLLLKAKYGQVPNAVLEDKAVSDMDGPAILIRTGTHFSLEHFGTERLKVEGITLDTYFKTNPKVDCLKVDTEGGEWRILRGAREIVRQNPQIRIVVELHLQVLALKGVAAEDMLQLFDSMDLDFGSRLYEPANRNLLQFVGNGYSILLWRKQHSIRASNVS